MSEDRGNAIRSRAPVWANVLELAEAWTPLDAPHKAKAATHNNQSGLDQWSGKARRFFEATSSAVEATLDVMC